jgi:murein DD-endopeptidase MepM/ murein hydrolase activator NlpD
MIRVSGKTKHACGIFGKVILTILISALSIFAIVLATYKPVYSVYMDGEFKGYVTSKNKVQGDIEEYLQEGDSDRVGYILLNSRPEYEFDLVKKDVETKDDDVLALVKDSCDIYYRVYAINVNEKDVCLAETLEDAQAIVDKVNAAQKSYTKKAKVMISEKFEKEYDAVADITVAANDIIKPIKKENEAIVKKVQTYAAAKTVPQEILDALKSQSADLKFGLPVTSYVITSRYGWRRSGYHTGCDYAAPMGTPIHAVEDGIVTCAEWKGNYGYLVKVQHAGGFETYYAHCSRFAVSVGDSVKKGDVVAYVGSTGNSTGPHCHLEIRYNGATIDPETLASGSNNA